VDAIAAEALETGFEAAPDAVSRVVERLRVIADLGCQVVGLPHALERHPENLFAAAFAVKRGGVDVVDPQLQGATDDLDSVLGREQTPPRAAVEPGAAEADLTHLPAGSTESPILHPISSSTRRWGPRLAVSCPQPPGRYTH